MVSHYHVQDESPELVGLPDGTVLRVPDGYGWVSQTENFEVQALDWICNRCGSRVPWVPGDVSREAHDRHHEYLAELARLLSRVVAVVLGPA